MVLRSGARPRLRGIALLPERHGQQPGARRAFPRAPRSARAVAAGFRIFRRRCPEAPVLHRPFRLLPPPSPPAFRTPKQGILGSRAQENAASCPKTGHFGFPNPENLAFVGQNRHFCPSVAGKTPLRWAKQGFLPIRGRENRQWRIQESGGKGEAGIRDR